MKCYNHPDIDAVGMCKACNKGVCITCAQDENSGIACSKDCASKTELTKLSKLPTNNNIVFSVSQKVIKSYVMIFSGLFLVINGLHQPYGHTPFIITGIIFFFLGAYSLNSGFFLRSK